MTAPFVSVLLPTCNGARWVADALRSILAQDYDGFECIVCDDGSSDRTVEIVRSFDDDRLSVLTNDTNRGLFPTLNRLVSAARGDLVRFIGQDDRLKPNCLREEAAFWQSHPGIALSYCQCDLIDESGAVWLPAPHDPTPEVVPPWLSTQIAYYHGCLQGNIATVTCRRDLLLAAGLFADMRVSGDFEMWTRIGAAHPIGFVRQPLVELRTHSGQFSRRVAERVHFAREDRRIYARLREAMPPRLSRVAAEFDRRRRVWGINYVVRRLAVGDLKHARELWDDLRSDGPVLPLLLRWAYTGNGRVFAPTPAYVSPAGGAARSPAALVSDDGRDRTERRGLRLLVVLTHPVQYFSPWFRFIAAEEPLVDLTVVYGTVPTASQQGAAFGTEFQWDTPLLEGYRSRVLRSPRAGDSTGAQRFRGIDAPGIGKVLDEVAPDVVLVPGWHSALYLRALLACRVRRIPAIYRGDSTLAASPTGWRRVVWRARTFTLLRLFSAWLAVGARAREYLGSFGVDGTRVFDSPHAVDNEWFAKEAARFQALNEREAARRHFGVDAAAFVILFVGKLESIKRPLDLIRAAARLDPPPTLLFAGAGPLERECRREAESLGITAAWPGFINQSALPAAYAASDVLAVPSERETWGLVVNEALATGLPCVVSDGVAAAADLLDSSTGAIHRRGDIADLARAIDGIRSRIEGGEDFRRSCRHRALRASYGAATAGLVRAAYRLVRPPRSAVRGPLSVPSHGQRQPIDL